MSADRAVALEAPQPPLFRATAIERLAVPDRLDMAAAIVRPAAWLILAGCFVFIAAALIAAFLITIPVKVAGNGILLDAAGVRDVVATAAGQIASVTVRSGDRVRAGDIIARIEQPDLKQDILGAEAELADARDQLTKTVALQNSTSAEQGTFRDQQRGNLRRSAGFAQERVNALTARLRDFEDLAARGIITKQRLLDARTEANTANEELAKTQSSLKQLDVEEAAQRAERERERLGLELKVASAQRKLDSLRERMGRVDVVTSAYNGIVGEMKVNNGEVVERGAALISIVPDTVANPGDEPVVSLVATIYVDPADGKKVRPGMDIEIVPSTVKREEFGFVRAKVTYVSDVPATQEGMARVLKNRQLAQSLANGGAPFEVRAELQPDPLTKSGLKWSTSAGPPIQVSSGSPCKADIITRSEPVLQVLVPATRALFDALAR